MRNEKQKKERRKDESSKQKDAERTRRGESERFDEARVRGSLRFPYCLPNWIPFYHRRDRRVYIYQPAARETNLGIPIHIYVYTYAVGPRAVIYRLKTTATASIPSVFYLSCSSRRVREYASRRSA